MLEQDPTPLANGNSRIPVAFIGNNIQLLKIALARQTCQKCRERRLAGPAVASQPNAAARVGFQLDRGVAKGALGAAAKAAGFQIERIVVEAEGVCPACVEKSAI